MIRNFFKRSTPPESSGPFASLKIALVADDLTRTALAHECQIRNVSPRNYRRVVRDWRPDLLLVESCWRGHRDAWRYRVASYPDHPKRNNRALANVVRFAREENVPAIFWNREDGVHFERFIDSAKIFDRVLTVDETMVPAYRSHLGLQAHIGTMMFAASRSLHFPTWERPDGRAAFVGSYGTHVHDARRAWQDMAFEAARPLGLTIFDRNSDRKPLHYRYPNKPWIETLPAVPHTRTPAIYRRHLVNLNVNTITNSTTAFSRRLVEILACGGFVVTNGSKAVQEHFADLCFSTDQPEEAADFFRRVARDGLLSCEQEMRRAAHADIHRHHSWCNRLPTIIEMAQA